MVTGLYPGQSCSLAGDYLENKVEKKNMDRTSEHLGQFMMGRQILDFFCGRYKDMGQNPRRNREGMNNPTQTFTKGKDQIQDPGAPLKRPALLNKGGCIDKTLLFASITSIQSTMTKNPGVYSKILMMSF